MNVIANIVKQSSLSQYLLSMTGFAEVIFITCNFLSSSLNESSFTLFLVANYIKIINVVRVYEILSFL